VREQVREQVRARVSGFGRALIDLLYPPLCWLCGCDAASAGDGHASGCVEHALPDGPPGVRCPICAGAMAAALEGAERCASCRRDSFGIERLVVLGDYRRQAQLREWVLAFKHGGRAELARPLAAALARRVRASVAQVAAENVLVPVPLHPWRRLERGYDQAARLGSELCDALGWPLARALVRTRPTVVQGTAGATSRSANVRGAFGAARWRPLARRAVAEAECVWIVDDVVTSGATLRECARALRRMGARRVCALALARATPHAGSTAGREDELEADTAPARDGDCALTRDGDCAPTRDAADARRLRCAP